MSNYAYSQSNDLISALPALEAKLMKTSCLKPRPFLDIEGAYWVPGDLSLIPKIILGQVPAGSRKQQLLKIIQYSLGRCSNYRQLNSRAELIIVKSQCHKIRVLYPNFILKVVRKQSDLEIPWLVKELEGRAAMRASSAGQIHVPRVIASGEEKGLYYLLEERLNCRPINQYNSDEKQQIKEELLPLLMDWYEPIRWDSMAHLLGEQPEALVEKALITSSLAEMEPDMVQVFNDVADHIDDYNIHIPVAMAHGDMNILNVCVTPKGKLVLVDWEKWGEHPVLMEFIYLARVFGFRSDVYHQIRQSYNRRFAGSDAGFDEQVLVYYFLKCSQKLVEISQIQNSQSHQPLYPKKTGDVSQSQRYVLRKLKICQNLLDNINERQGSVPRQTCQLPLY